MEPSAVASSPVLKERGARYRIEIFSVVLFLLVLFSATFVRLQALDKRPLWADEVFSLSAATGHQLVTRADEYPSPDDYTDTTGITTATRYCSYLRMPKPQLAMGKVLRAVGRLDPPLYYALLHIWLLLVGTTDDAVRSLSVIFSLVTVACIWSLSRLIGCNAWTATLACSFFAFAPISIYYSTETKQYALCCLLSTVLCLSAVLINKKRGLTFPLLCIWIMTALCAIFAHPYLFFISGICALWLCAVGDAKARIAAAAGIAVSLAAFFFWHHSAVSSHIRESWLCGFPPAVEALRTPYLNFLYYFDNLTKNSLYRKALWLPLASGAIALAVMFRRNWPVVRPIALLLLCVIAACFGPLIIDLLRNMHTSTVPRYAISGLPIVSVIFGWLMMRSPHIVKGLCIALLIAVWLPGWQILLSPDRENLKDNFRHNIHKTDQVVLASIPAQNLAIARYLPGETRIVSWTKQCREHDAVSKLIDWTSSAQRIFLFGADGTDIGSIGSGQVRRAFAATMTEVAAPAISTKQDLHVYVRSKIPSITAERHKLPAATSRQIN